MSKDKISDYSATANSNTDIGGINIDEGCAPSGINDAIRTLMKQIKDWQSGSQDVYIHPAGSASIPSITATGDTNTGIFFPAADTVGITTGGTERARVDSSGNLGLGVTPSAWQSIRKAIQVGDTGVLFYGNNQTAVGNNAYINSSGQNTYIKTGVYPHLYLQGSGGEHQFYSASTGTAGNAISFTLILSAEKDKSLALQGASSYTGTGITFPATQSASTDANTLDDYEEGTWTPTIILDSGSLSGYATEGTYVKVGKQVTVQVYVSCGTSTGASINGVSGLPFTTANTNPVAVGTLRENSVTGYQWEIRANGNTTQTLFRRYDNASAVSTGFVFIGTVTYFTN